MHRCFYLYCKRRTINDDDDGGPICVVFKPKLNLLQFVFGFEIQQAGQQIHSKLYKKWKALTAYCLFIYSYLVYILLHFRFLYFFKAITLTPFIFVVFT